MASKDADAHTVVKLSELAGIPVCKDTVDIARQPVFVCIFDKWGLFGE